MATPTILYWQMKDGRVEIDLHVVDRKKREKDLTPSTAECRLYYIQLVLFDDRA